MSDKMIENEKNQMGVVMNSVKNGCRGLYVLMMLCLTFSSVEAASQLKILSFNTWRVEDTQSGRDAIVDIVNVSGADIVGFQELSHASEVAAALGGGWNLYSQDSSDKQIMSRYPIVSSSPNKQGVKVELPSGTYAWVFNVHLPAYPYQPYDLRDGTLSANEVTVIAAANNARGSQVAALLNDITAVGALTSGDMVFLTGDFNEPSHHDWTQAAVDHTSRTYDIKVEWPASKRITDVGFTDSLRNIRPDEVNDYAYTWTPLPSSNEVHDRIDIIYFAGPDVTPASVQNIGPVGINPNTDIEYAGYPSDHRAVLATFEFIPPVVEVADNTVLTGAGGNTNDPVPADHGSNVQDTPHVALTWAPTGGANNSRNQWEQYNDWPGGGEGGAVYQVDSSGGYLEHTITFTPESGYSVVLTSLDLNVWAGGGDTDVDWTVTGSSSGLLGSGTFTTPDGAVATHAINLAGSSSETVTLSLLQTSGADAYLGMDNLTFSEKRVLLFPDPAHGEANVEADLSDRDVIGAVSWVYMNDPNISQVFGYDVYFDPNETLVAAGDPSVKVVNNQSGTSYMPTLDWDKTYYWRVDMIVDLDFVPGTDPNTVVGDVWLFTTKQEDIPPVVEAGDNLLTTLELVSFPNSLMPGGSVEDDGVSILTIGWEAFDVALGGGLTTKVTFADATDPATTVTISEAGTYILKLTATDNNGSVSDQMEIVVFEDACEAKKATGTWAANYYDRNEDCIVDIKDFADFALEWLDSTALTESVIYTMSD